MSLIFSQLLKQLFRLYNNLPAKLQSRKKEIPASELVIKAIEFITLLREVLALNPECETEAEANGANDDDVDSPLAKEERNRNYSPDHSFDQKRFSIELEQKPITSSSQHVYRDNVKLKDEKYGNESMVSTEQDVCIEINPSDILPPPDENNLNQASDIRFSKSLDGAQVKSTISLPRNLRITPVGKLNQQTTSRIGTKQPELIRHHTSSSSYLSSSCHNFAGSNNFDDDLSPPTLIRSEASMKTGPSPLKILKIPHSNGEKGLPTVIEFPKGSPFLTKLDTKVGEDTDENQIDGQINGQSYTGSGVGQSLLRKHLQEPAKGIQDSTERQKIRIRKDLVASSEENEYKIMGNNGVSEFSGIKYSSSSNHLSKNPFSQTEFNDDILPQICISSVESLRNKDNPFTETPRRDSIERRRGRPVVQKKTSKSRQAEEFNGELSMFKDYDKYDFFNYLSTSCLRITDKDAETILTYNWMHELMFETVYSYCSDVQFARFCQVVSIANDLFDHQAASHSSDNSVGRKPCVLLTNSVWNRDKIKGMVTLSGRSYCLPLVLIKLFRPNFEQVLLSKIVLYSKKQCDISNPNIRVDRGSTLCVNPWHYERCDEEKFLSKSVGHECQVRLFADAVNGTRPLCFLCKSPGTIEKIQPHIPTMPLSPPTPPPSGLELTPINVTNNVIPDQDQELKIYVERPKYKIGDRDKIVTIRKKNPKIFPKIPDPPELKDQSPEEADKKQQQVRRPQMKYDGSVCINCGTTNTTLWRRTPDGQLICNACGCYLKLHGRHRPIKFKSDAIRTRRRKRSPSSAKKDKEDAKAKKKAKDDAIKNKDMACRIVQELEKKSQKEEEQSAKSLDILFESANLKSSQNVDDKSVEEMEEDFEGMIKDFEEEINKEGDIVNESNESITEKGEQAPIEIAYEVDKKPEEEKSNSLEPVTVSEGDLSNEILIGNDLEQSSYNEDLEVIQDDESEEILLIIDETKDTENDIVDDDVEMNDTSTVATEEKSDEVKDKQAVKVNEESIYINGSIEDVAGLQSLEDTISVNAVEDAISVSSGTDSGSESRQKRFINVIDGNTNGIDIIDLKKEPVDTDSESIYSEKSDKGKPSSKSKQNRLISSSSNFKEKSRSPKVAGHYGYQCRRCFDWFDTKLNLNNHNCSRRYLMSENGNMPIFVCKFCGCFEHNKEKIKPHVERCKTFGFTRLYHNEGVTEAIKQQSSNEIKSEEEISSRQSRKRPNRQTSSSKEESTCSQCNNVRICSVTLRYFVYQLNFQ